jgi:hypothetical protein
MGPRILIGLAVAFFTSSVAFAQSWDNPAGGDWGVTTNWNPAGAPSAPVFNLNSSGYTTSISTNYSLPSALSGTTVQTDNVTLDLNGNTLTTPSLNVANAAGETGSLAVVGPGTVNLVTFITSSNFAGSVNVGTNGGVGQLTINGATVKTTQTGENTGKFIASNLTVENGGQLSLQAFSTISIPSAVFNDGSMSAPSIGPALSLSNITMTNGSSISANAINLNGASLDDSTIVSGGSGGTVSGVVTLSDNSSMNIAGQTVAGTINIMATSKDHSDAIMMDSTGVLSVELYNGIDNPIVRPFTDDLGTLDFTLENGFTPSIGEQFQVMDDLPPVDPYTGTFATINLPTLSGATWNTSQFYSAGIISVVVPEPVSLGMAAMAAVGLCMRRQRRNKSALRPYALTPTN